MSPLSRTTLRTLAPLALALLAGTALAGPITPPVGPVTSTMKTLSEVEPRIAINATNTPGDANSVYRISQPGSYYLAGNIAGIGGRNAVVFIAADGVTLDLRGFQIVGNGGQYGVEAGAVRGTAILNGSVKDLGTAGISLGQSSGTTVRDLCIINASESGITLGAHGIVERCTIVQSGLGGISVGASSIVRDCTASGGSIAFTMTRSVVENCSATGAEEIGFSVGENSTVTGCTASACGSGFQAASQARFINCGVLGSTAAGSAGTGILSGFNGIVDHCSAINGMSDGILANDGATIRNCTVTANAGYGIVVDSRCTIVGNTSSGNGPSPAFVGAGIKVNGVDCRVESNNIIGNDYGIQVTATGNIIIRNTASGNSVMNYNSVAGNIWGAVTAPATTPAFSANTGVGGTGTTDPNANFSY